MLETNLRIVQPGPDLVLRVRRAQVRGTDLTTDLLQRACGRLQRRHHLAAIPAAPIGMRGDTEQAELFVLTDHAIPTCQQAGDNWEFAVTDADLPPVELRFADPAHGAGLAHLIERVVHLEIGRRTNWWQIAGRPRIWYEAAPFHTADGLAAYQRYAVSCLPIDGVGIGIAVEVGVGFFTTETLADVFDPTRPAQEQCQRAQRLEQLLGRQRGQKGTLLYDNGRTRTVAYFEQPPNGKTCATTGVIRIGMISYPSLAAYYRQTNPQLRFEENGPALRVSFRGFDRPQWVAAARVRARVMNEHLPASLKQDAAQAPHERRRATEAFWRRLGPRPVGAHVPDLIEGFWRPAPDRVRRLPLPPLRFGHGAVISTPTAPLAHLYQQQFRARQATLDRQGCYAIPPATGRDLYCAYPDSLPTDAVQRFGSDVALRLRQWMQIEVSVIPVAYHTLRQAVEQLKRLDPGVVLFVLGSEPTAYYEAAFALPGWRLKRVTERTLGAHWTRLRPADQQTDDRQGVRRWEQLITMTTLDVLQQMDAIPWRISAPSPYEARVVIDVGYNRRHYALSLLIMRDESATPTVRLVTRVLNKPDTRQEAINPRLLEDDFTQIVEQGVLRGGSDPASRSEITPLASLLVLRDGRTVAHEHEGIAAAIARLTADGWVTADARIDVVDIQKDTMKGIRLWEVGAANEVSQALEGTLVLLDAQTLIMITTGQATLRQGTAEPLLLTTTAGESVLVAAAETVFADAQLNWASPQTAQRLPLPLKRTDEELSTRANQEVRRLT